MKRIFAVITVLAICAAVTGCKGENTAEQIKLPIYGAEEISFEVAQAEYMDISQTDSTAAVIGYPYATYLTFPAQAQVLSAELTKNSKVSKGDVLVVLDSSELDYEINNQQTKVNAAYNASLSGGAAAGVQYQIEKNTLDMLLEKKAAYTITAPFDGIITEAYRPTIGSTVNEGDVCCAISTPEDMRVYIEGGAADGLRYGQKIQVRLDNDMYDATVVSAPDVMPATASKKVAHRAILDLGEGTLTGIYEKDPMVINAGWATAYITRERRNVLAVPAQAVKTRGSSSTVTLVDGDERFKLPVTIGDTLGGYTEILNGISAGDIVMAEGSGEYSTAKNKE
ncbi:MAG: efflux RND transporter periplasmic adaptor subunit [Oscillospiraceae bacterium]